MDLNIVALKVALTVIYIVLIAYLAEKISPRIGGILAGFPTFTAVVLFFFAYEISPEFAAQSAVYNMLGLISVMVFAYAYYRTASYVHRRISSKAKLITVSSIAAFIAYFAVSYLFQKLRVNVVSALIITIPSLVFGMFLMRWINDTIITKRVPMTTKLVTFRALLAATIVVIVTGIARYVGPEWAGLFSCFPATVYSMTLIMHLTYGTENTYTVIKNVPFGLISVVLYALTVYFTYPTLGIYWGTLIGFGIACIYLIILLRVQKKISYKQSSQ